MKKHLSKSILLFSTILSCFFLNSCADYVDGDPSVISQGQSQGSIEIKILSGSEKDKVIKSSGMGVAIGTKRTSDGNFMVYQITGTFQNVGFGCQVTNESGEENFGDLAIYFNSGVSDVYTSIDDDANIVKITDIKLTEKHDQVGAQIMNGKATFKGKFVKEDVTGSGSEEEMLVEGTITF